MTPSQFALDYARKLKDPRWQRKRLDIMNRDGFKCAYCQDKSKTLHVHHKFYESGKEPWEYENTALVTLCEDCHAMEEREKQEAIKNIHKALASFGFLNVEISYLAGLLLHLKDSHKLTGKEITQFIEHIFGDTDLQKTISEACRPKHSTELPDLDF